MSRKRKKTSGRRRRRIGSVALSANSPLVKFGSIGAGYLLADKINEQLAKVTGEMDPKIVNGVLAAGGLYLLFMHKGRKSTVVTALAGLATGVGAKGLLTEFGAVSGFRDLQVVSGFNKIPTVGYTPQSGMINGVPGASGYQVPPVMGSVPGVDDGSGINSTDR